MDGNECVPNGSDGVEDIYVLFVFISAKQPKTDATSVCVCVCVVCHCARAQTFICSLSMEFEMIAFMSVANMKMKMATTTSHHEHCTFNDDGDDEELNGFKNRNKTVENKLMRIPRMRFFSAFRSISPKSFFLSLSWVSANIRHDTHTYTQLTHELCGMVAERWNDDNGIAGAIQSSNIYTHSTLLANLIVADSRCQSRISCCFAICSTVSGRIVLGRH